MRARAPCGSCRPLRLPGSLLLTLLAVSWTAGSSPEAVPPARVWEQNLTIPTYELGKADPNPALFGSFRGRPVYPYPVLDSLGNTRRDKSHRAVYLENDYLRVIVLPELGGRIYAIFDKLANRDVLYTNHVVKPAIVGIRGAWTAGGIEWNFPDGHSVTTMSPVDYVTGVGADGSVAVTVGETERIQGMQWVVTVRLRPGRKVVETEITLNNRRETPGRYWYWANAAAHATDDQRFVYPMREAYPHTLWPVFSFPKEKGVDIGRSAETPNPLSLFARKSMRDFLAVYYQRSDWGMVHVADHRELPGKKTWTWGNDEAAQVWTERLTDNDGPYVEFQAGRFETQMEHQFIAPHCVERFVQYWYPVDRMQGGLDEANSNGALHAIRRPGVLRIVLNVTESFSGASLAIEASGRAIHSRSVDLTPAAPFILDTDLPETLGNAPLTIRVTGRDGRRLFDYRTDMPVDGNPAFKPAERPSALPAIASSAERAYLDGLGADKKSDIRRARVAYQQALQRDPGFGPAHVALGLSFFLSGEYENAGSHLQAAIQRNPDSAEAHYYLGLVRRAQGRLSEAKDELFWVVRSGYLEAAARFVLGEISLMEADGNEAVRHLTESVVLNPKDLKARTVLGMAERLAGKLEAARRDIEAVVDQAPIDCFALREQSEIYRVMGRDPEAARARQTLDRLVAREPDSALELAFDYAAAGQPGQAAAALKEAAGQIHGFAMLHYALGYFCALRGDQSCAGRQYKLAAAGNPEFVFPHRVEEIEILRSALARNPNDGRAAYYLGNALASKYREAEAMEAWRQALRLDPSNAVAHRNLAQGLFAGGNPQEAVEEFRRAIQYAPEDFHLYLELDRVLAKVKPAADRIQLLERAPATVRSHPAVALALAAAYADGGLFAESARLMGDTAFAPGEGDSDALAVYRRAHIGLAREYHKTGRHEEAAREFLRATEYPPHLGVGRPAFESLAREYVAAAREFEEARRSSDADPLWRKAAEDPLKSPTDPFEPWSEHYYYKAVALERLRRTAEARALYSRLAALVDDRRISEEPIPPSGSTCFLLAGLGLKALGDAQLARKAFERALEIDPTNEPAASALRELKAGVKLAVPAPIER